MRAPLLALVLASGVTLRALAQRGGPGFDCGFPGGSADVSVERNCQVRRGPINQTRAANDAWRSAYEQWRTSTRAAFDFSAFDTPEIGWARTSFVQPQAMLHDRYLYDRETRQWTVGRFLDDLEERYGGIDSVLLWQFYPNSGIDSRNNFDFIDSLPGGMAAVQDVIRQFHARGVKVLWPIFPWDTGTNSFGVDGPNRMGSVEVGQEIPQVAFAIETGADGFNGDTISGVPALFWEESVRRGVPLVAEPEIMGAFIDNHGQGLETNFMSWAYWGPLTGGGWDARNGGVDAYKSLEVRHMTHICERWAGPGPHDSKKGSNGRGRTDGLHHFFFNGIGYESWENVWGIWNGLTDRHAAMLKRMATILRSLDGITSRGDTEWHPHVPYSCGDEDCTVAQSNIFISQFIWQVAAFYAIINRQLDGGDRTVTLTLPCEPGHSFRVFDLYHGQEIHDPSSAPVSCSAWHGSKTDHRATVIVVIEPMGFAAILTLRDVAPDADVTALMQTMQTLSQPPLVELSAVWQPLQQTLTSNPPTPSMNSSSNFGMSHVAGGIYDYESSNNCIEGSDLVTAVGVQMPWMAHPARTHRQRIQMQSFYMDTQLVTNEQYHAYLHADGGARPEDTQNWLQDWKGDEKTAPPVGASSHPVRWVSRKDADAYCRHYGKRLPTTYEWQYAAQGVDGRRYPWGDEFDSNNVARLSNDRPIAGWASHPTLEDVATHPGSASPFGIEDMVGHVYQWTDEACDEHTCKGILRGGSSWYPLGSNWYFPQPGGIQGMTYWNTPRGDLTVHNTLLLLSESMDRSALIGFRCVADIAVNGGSGSDGSAATGGHIFLDFERLKAKIRAEDEQENPGRVQLPSSPPPAPAPAAPSGTPIVQQPPAGPAGYVLAVLIGVAIGGVGGLATAKRVKRGAELESVWALNETAGGGASGSF